MSMQLPSTQIDTYREVARLVAGENAPDWLAGHFASWTPTVFLDRAVSKVWPSRKGLLEQLNNVKIATAFLQQSINSPAMRSALCLQNVTVVRLCQMLTEIGQNAALAATSNELVDNQGKPRPGRPSQDARLLCAALIAETWAYFHHRKEPAARNKDLAIAAAKLWAATGDETAGWGNDPLNRWRPWFEKASEPKMSPFRAECRRHLMEASRYADSVSGAAGK
jgi:hypothetical protein